MPVPAQNADERVRSGEVARSGGAMRSAVRSGGAARSGATARSRAGVDVVCGQPATRRERARRASERDMAPDVRACGGASRSSTAPTNCCDAASLLDHAGEDAVDRVVLADEDDVAEEP